MVGLDRMLGNDKFMARAGKMGIKPFIIGNHGDQLTLTGSTNLGRVVWLKDKNGDND